MNLDFNDEQQALRAAVARWVEKAYGFPRRQALARAGGHSRALWGELAELGLAGLVLPEAYGGQGCGPVEALVVAEELGRGLVQAPWAEAALVAPTLLSAAPDALKAAWLPRMASGQALVVPALWELKSRYRLEHVATSARQEGAHWVLTGSKTLVPAGDEAQACLVSARISGKPDDAAGIGLFLVDSALAPGRGFATQDGGRAAEITLALTPAQLICPEAQALLQQAWDVAVAAQCAEAVGLMDRLLQLTADYMNTRQQFGVPIASFQALRHRLADAKLQLELARGMSWYASLMLEAAPDERRRAVSQARVQLGQSMRFVGQQCIQLHGGIGVTDDYQAGHYFKRLTMLELGWGDSLHHLGEVAQRLQDQAGVLG
jgi:alkylation response protein AidB-like acyl-CoA dehydrogenase